MLRRTIARRLADAGRNGKWRRCDCGATTVACDTMV